MNFKPRTSKRSTLVASAVSVLFLVGIGLAYWGPSSAPGGRDASPSPAGTLQQPRVLEVLDDLRKEENGRGSDAPVKLSDEKVKLKKPFAVRDGNYSALGIMRIPAIGLKTKFYSGVVDEVVENGPGHWPGTPNPGNAGNSVFAGHRTTFTAPFADLNLLQPGNRITTKVGRNAGVTYRVLRTTVVAESEYVDFVLRQPKKKRVRILTLFACTPKGQRTHRIVVSARARKATEK
ncbi:MAG TPA: class E sortase [Actinomycetota bacterium]|nr:class E sortase [Actinomycetota bacterium]